VGQGFQAEEGCQRCSQAALAAAAAGPRFPDAVLCSKPKGFVSSPGTGEADPGSPSAQRGDPA